MINSAFSFLSRTKKGHLILPSPEAIRRYYTLRSLARTPLSSCLGIITGLFLAIILDDPSPIFVGLMGLFALGLAITGATFSIKLRSHEKTMLENIEKARELADQEIGGAA